MMGYLKRSILAVILGLGICFQMQAQNFALPRPPQDMKSIPARAGYVVEHYWDNADLASISERDMEQAFVNYLSVFPLTESDSLCHASAGHLMSRADSAGVAGRVLVLAEKYLFNADSPMLEEEYFLGFVSGAGECSSISEEQRIRIPYWQNIISCNRRGLPVEDFCFETAGGTLRYFSSVPGPKLLLLFDTDCSDCREMIESLSSESLDFTVVAVAVNCTRKRFRSFLPSLPSDWVAGWDSTGRINGDVFAIRHLPDVFLVDSDGIVLQKHRIDVLQGQSKP